VNILVFTPYYKPAYIYGGPARSIPALCEGLTKGGANVTVFTTNANGLGKVIAVPTNLPLDIDGVVVSYFSVDWPLARLYPFYSSRLGQACKSYISKFDVVYIAGNWTYPVWAGASSAERTKTPYIISPRGSFMKWSMGEKMFKKRVYLALLERRIVNHAAAIHVTSLLEKAQLRKWNFTPPVFTIPNGINIKPFTHLPQRGKLRDSLGIPQKSTVSLFVGRLHKEKRLDLIIKSFANFSQELSNTHLLIVGSDQDGTGKMAKDLVSRLCLSSQVHFLGPLIGDNLMQAYVDSDLLVLMSHRENFGMVVLEALAIGLPVLLTKEVGLADEIEQSKSGLVVEANEIEAGKVWRNLLLEQDVRESMGKKGAALVCDRFETGIVASKMADLLHLVSAKD
jgi:glycosyltransferase involved in cell wall biosynthesis